MPQTPDYRTITLMGDPATLAAAQADLLRPVEPPFRRNPWEEDSAFLRDCVGWLRAVYPPLWEELAAFAALMEMPIEQGLFVRAGTLAHGCSAFAWLLDDGRVLAGRNYDFYIRMPTRHLLRTVPQQGYAHIGMNGGLVGGRYDGINERGLFVALHKVMANRPATLAPGLPYHLFPRIVLETCATADEAAALIAGIPHLASFNYTLADSDGRMIALECYPGERIRARRCVRSIAVANHYQNTHLALLQGRRPLDHSRARVALMRQLPPPDADPWQAAQAVLADHSTPVCCHKEFGATLWSGVFDLTARRAAYAFGPPCATPFHEVETLFNDHGVRNTTKMESRRASGSFSPQRHRAHRDET